MNVYRGMSSSFKHASNLLALELCGHVVYDCGISWSYSLCFCFDFVQNFRIKTIEKSIGLASFQACLF